MGGAEGSFESFGVRFAISVGSRVPHSAWREALPPGSARRARGAVSRRYRIERAPRGYTLGIDDEAVSCASVRAVSDALEGDLALHVAAHAPHHVFIHAGVVAWRGRALVIPGRSMSGKSTLVARLVAEGATYYSDEYAVLDPNGRVLPYPRRLSLRRAQGLPRRVRASRVGRRRLPIGWVVAARYAQMESALALEPLSQGRTALVLLDNAVAARLAAERVLKTLRRVVDSASGFSGARGEARLAAPQLLSRCKGECRVITRRSSGGNRT